MRTAEELEYPTLINIDAPSYIANAHDLAKLIMDYLTKISTPPAAVFPARIRFAAEIDPDMRMIHILVYGLTNVELAHPYDRTPDAPSPVHITEIIAKAADSHYNCNHRHATGNRFFLRVPMLNESRQHAQAGQVGTVSLLISARRRVSHGKTATPSPAQPRP